MRDSRTSLRQNDMVQKLTYLTIGYLPIGLVVVSGRCAWADASATKGDKTLTGFSVIEGDIRHSYRPAECNARTPYHGAVHRNHHRPVGRHVLHDHLHPERRRCRAQGLGLRQDSLWPTAGFNHAGRLAAQHLEVDTA